MGRDMENIAEPNMSKARRQQLLDEIMQEAADIVLSKIRKLKNGNAQDEHHMNVPVANPPCLVDLREVARVFKERLEDLHSNEGALVQRLYKWKKRGIDHDPVAARGRPRSLVTSTVIANLQAQGHIGPKAAIPVACGQTHYDCFFKKRQKNVFQRMSEESGLIEGSRKLRQSSGNIGGRPVNSEFERVVIERIERQVRYQGLSLPTVSHSLQAIVVAGKETAQEAPFCNSKVVQRLKFSICWAVGVCRRQLANDGKQHRTMPLRL
jgi:hypothetical protein